MIIPKSNLRVENEANMRSLEAIYRQHYFDFKIVNFITN